MPKHVRVNLEAKLRLDACAFDHTGETGGAERRAWFRCGCDLSRPFISIWKNNPLLVTSWWLDRYLDFYLLDSGQDLRGHRILALALPILKYRAIRHKLSMPQFSGERHNRVSVALYDVFYRLLCCGIWHLAADYLDFAKQYVYLRINN